MSKITTKKVFPLVPGTEISFKYKNNFGNKVAINITSEAGLEFDNLEGDLKNQVLSAVRAGTLVIKEVEVKTKAKKADTMLKDLEKHAAKKPVETEAKPVAKEKHEVAQATTDETGVHGRRRGK